MINTTAGYAPFSIWVVEKKAILNNIMKKCKKDLKCDRNQRHVISICFYGKEYAP